jgi:hypothetical protein
LQTRLSYMQHALSFASYVHVAHLLARNIDFTDSDSR